MKVVVVGAGLIGVTTACLLRHRGHEVAVIDRGEGVGREASFANGALLTPSMSDPWNAPGSWRVLLSSLARSDAPLQLRLRQIPSLASWGATFLRNSRAAAFERNSLSNLRLALYSLEVMESIRRITGLEYGRTARGSLRVFRDHAGLDRAQVAANRLSSAGVSYQKLSAEEAAEFEPGLAPIVRQLAGALHYGTDETGDAYRFCVALAEYARRQGVAFYFRTTVRALQLRSGRITAVVSDRKQFVADQYIVAAGCYSTPLLSRIGIDLPVRPVKGYSVTLDSTDRDAPLRVPIIDDHLHAVIVPLEGAIRVAGTAEFAGYDRTVGPNRVRNLLGLLKQVLPQEQFDTATAKSWCGLRAMSADGVPIIGPTPISNLLVNTGHGHLGWTMAAGSAQLLADIIADESTSIDPAPYNLMRFAK